ncbi:MAG: helix-turn-helix domain-containing protein [Acidobacteriia bacterium]|nr:helix-turn-helix domain-containing protein [Terriglobia bacterium]
MFAMKRRGRKPKPHTDKDIRLMSDVSKQLTEQIGKRFSGKAIKFQAAQELGVSRAALYNYIRKIDVPGMDVLERLNQKWGLEFAYGVLKLDTEFFRAQRESRPPATDTRSTAQQYVLPFIEGLREQDIEVLQVTPHKPSSVDVRLRIRFAG